VAAWVYWGMEVLDVCGGILFYSICSVDCSRVLWTCGMGEIGRGFLSAVHVCPHWVVVRPKVLCVCNLLSCADA
jgi:hypothetical protein